MKKSLTTILASVALGMTSLAIASSPITVINNTHGTVDFRYTHCNNAKLCTLVNEHRLNSKNISSHSVSLIAPLGMEHLAINSAKMYDDAHHNSAKLVGGCIVPDNIDVVVLNTYGTGTIYCTYGNGA